MTDFSILNSLIYRFSSCGVKTENRNGSTLIGYAPFIAKEAWLNHLFKPLTIEDINTLEKMLNRTIPEEYKDFLTHYSNGLILLNGHLSLYGLRYYYYRDAADRQPFSIVIKNSTPSEKPSNATKEMFFFGSYLENGSLLYFDHNDEICFCTRNDAYPLKKWDSFVDMLISEIERIYALFDDFGHPTTGSSDFWGFLSVKTEPLR